MIHLAKRGAGEALRLSKAATRSVWHRRVLRTGVDDTEATALRTCLVIAPHPDDETIGCGAMIARKRAAGVAVHVVVVTDGRHSHTSRVIAPHRLAELRAEESVRACGLLGVNRPDVRFLRYEEYTLFERGAELSSDLGDLIGEFEPDEVVMTSELDWHVDHQAVYQATLRAVSKQRYPGILRAYPVWFWADGPWRTMPTDGAMVQLRHLLTDPAAAVRLPRADVVSTAGFADLKRQAFECYLSQRTNLTGEPTWATFSEGWIEPFLSPAEVFFRL